VGQAPGPNFRYQDLNSQQRQQVSGLSDAQRAAVHLYGIQVTSAGKNDGGVILNVLQNPSGFKPAEVELAKRIYQYEMQTYGGLTGKGLDAAFFEVYKAETGVDLNQRYGNRPITYAQGPVNMENRITGNNGLGSMSNSVLRLWGHDTLDNGLNDGSVVQWTLNSQNSLDAGLNRGDLQALLAADGADNGTRDGSALGRAFIQTLDQVNFGTQAPTQQSVLGQSGITNQQQMQTVLQRLAQNPPPGVPPGVDITNVQNIGRCPVLAPSVQQSGLAGLAFQ
jgi:hypothetical protein